MRDLTKTFQTRDQAWEMRRSAKPAPAVDGVSFDIKRGECLGLVGESGCGKTTVSKILMRAVTPDAGSVIYNDGSGPVDVLARKGDDLQRLRTQIQMVFQDPVSSLSPRMTVGNILSEPLDIHRRGTPADRRETVEALLGAIGLGQGARHRYPHSFSGGQRQRVGIARALALAPGLDRLRRAGFGPGCVGAGADSEPAERPAERSWADLSVHLAQSGGGRLHGRPGGGDVGRADRGNRPARGDHDSRPCIPTPGRCWPLCRIPIWTGRWISRPSAGPAPLAPKAGLRPFARPPEDRAALQPIDLGDGHFVLAHPSADLRELTA